MFTNNLISVKAAKKLWSILLGHILPAHCFTAFSKRRCSLVQVGRKPPLETAHGQFPHSKYQPLFCLHYQILYLPYMAPQMPALRATA